MGKASTICPQYMTYKRLHIVEWGSLQFLLLLHVANYQPCPGMDAAAGKEVYSFYVFSQVGVRIQKIQQVEPQTGKLVWKGNSSENLCWSPINLPVFSWRGQIQDQLNNWNLKSQLSLMILTWAGWKSLKAIALFWLWLKIIDPKESKRNLCLEYRPKFGVPSWQLRSLMCFMFFFKWWSPSKMVCIFSVFKVAEDAEFRSSIHWQKPTGVALLSLLPLLCRSKAWPNPRWFGCVS